MSRSFILGLVALMATIMAGCSQPRSPTPAPSSSDDLTIDLPQPRLHSSVSVEQALLNRRSVREYADAPLTLEEVSQLLWAAQGLTAEWGGRTAPSAGALYPLELHLVVGNVSDLAPGVYRYWPSGHRLVKRRGEDLRGPLAEAALGQASVREGAIDIVIAAVYERTTGKYGVRGDRYVHMEAGHATQNLYLQATSLDLGMVTIGAFYDDQVREILGLPDDEAPLYIVPVGRKKEDGPTE